jgi:MYXO-CTERM domain-containing protein|tara:strand:+ start:420 stop:1049 length:630 start_codon:yes stop_codon:yes gene_type:complete
MKARILASIVVAGTAGLAHGQAVTGFTGGSQFGSFFGGTVAGDTVGWQFTVNEDIFVTGLGVWNGDTQLGLEGLTSNHQVGIWNLGSGALLIDGVAGPGGSVIGAWTYSSVADTVLTTGNTYVIGAVYTSTDGDSYISSASSVTMASAINFGGGRSPLAANGGFALPGTFSGATSLGRFGPNFTFRPVPTPGAIAVLGLGGLVATRRRR